MKLCWGKGYARRRPKGREVLGIGQDLSKEIVKRSLFMFEEKEIHLAAARAAKRINRERGKKRESPTGKGTKKRTHGRMNSMDKSSVENGRGKCDRRIINPVVTNHFEVLVGNVYN